MTPRARLIDELVSLNLTAEQEIKLGRLLKKFAIGKWVPVSERLPNKAREGLVIMDNKQAIAEFEPSEPGIEHSWHAYGQHLHDESVTHWLELDIPEVEA